MAANKSVAKVEEEKPMGLPAHLAKRAAEDAGKGLSKAQEDNVVPLIYVLQALSPQVNKRSPAYIEGAEAGKLWLRSAPEPIVDEIIFQPCFFSKDWVEWIPRDNGGGMVNRYSSRPAEAVDEPDRNNPNRIRVKMPNGNDMVETRYHVGFAYLPSGLVMPYVIPLSSTGHQVSRNWMFMMNSKQIPGAGTAPSWACRYKVGTVEREKSGNRWFVLSVSDAGWVESEEEYERGAALNKAFSEGAKVIDTEERVVEEDTEHAPF